MKENVVNRIKTPILVVLLLITVLVSNVKKSINHVTYAELDKIQGVGQVKAERILNERESNGHYRGEEDFRERLKNSGVGELVINRIKKAYALGNK